ncbi:hypothetical protein LQZ19_11615 [Treponema primitia]|uniref:hypothetical protein n=1 Tax=Treponema primitia TaxID=88058 RepID=UPI00397F9AC8
MDHHEFENDSRHLENGDSFYKSVSITFDDNRISFGTYICDSYKNGSEHEIEDYYYVNSTDYDKLLKVFQNSIGEIDFQNLKEENKSFYLKMEDALRKNIFKYIAFIYETKDIDYLISILKENDIKFERSYWPSWR